MKREEKGGGPQGRMKTGGVRREGSVAVRMREMKGWAYSDVNLGHLRTLSDQNAVTDQKTVRPTNIGRISISNFLKILFGHNSLTTFRTDNVITRLLNV